MNEKVLTAIKDMQNNKIGGRIRLEDIRQMLKSDLKLDYANSSSVCYLYNTAGFELDNIKI